MLERLSFPQEILTFSNEMLRIVLVNVTFDSHLRSRRMVTLEWRRPEWRRPEWRRPEWEVL
jgi:hypothetical protein